MLKIRIENLLDKEVKMPFLQVSLGELYNISSGLSKGKSFFGHGFPFLTFKTVFDNFFLPNELSELADTTEKERESCSILKGDVFLTRTSENTDELGMSSVALKDYPNATFNGFTKRLRPKQCVKINPIFASYWFRSTFFRKQVKSMSVMTTRASLNTEMIQRLTMPLPTIEEQNNIVNILYPLDEKIAINIKVNHHLEQMAQAKFDDMFPSVSFGDSTVGEYITPKRGKTLISKEAISGEVPVIAGGLVPTVYHNVANTQEPVITISASGANAGFVNLWSVPVWSSDSSFIDKAMTDDVYFWYVMLKKRQSEIYESQTGSAQPHIYPSHIAGLPTIALDKDEIVAFTEFATPLFDKIAINLAENLHLASLRDTLLPRLMTGELSVADLGADK